MSVKKDFLHTVIDEILALDAFKLSSERSTQILDFIDAAINGDTPELHLTIDANLTKNKLGVIVYILTNMRLIKIDIDTHEIKSVSFFLDKIISIERKLVDGDNTEVLVSFENDSFGLRYPAKSKNITEVFQKIDQYRMKRISQILT